jgi:DNA repair exonuclease SbcCD ATPase subunit
MFRVMKVSGVSGLTLLMLSFWLFGASAPRHLKVLSEGARSTIVEGIESPETQLRVVDEEIERARKETHEIAHAVGEVKATAQAVHQAIERLSAAQRADEGLLGELKAELRKIGDHGVVRIGDKEFARLDLEHDAQVILDRHHARQDQIQDEKNKLHELERRQDGLQTSLREHLCRIRKLEVGQEEGRRLADQKKFNDWLAGVDGRPVANQALGQAESSQASVLRNLRCQAAGAKVIEEMTAGGPTPAADTVNRAKNHRDIFAQIDEVVKQR